jgi:glutamine amidotransferase
VTSVAVIDYRLCNLDSIARAVAECGAEVEVTGDPRTLEKVDRIILPGVGSFGAAMANLTSAGFDIALREAVIGRRLPLLGICLGMQLLGQRGTEHGDHAGLGLLHGTVVRLDPATATDPASVRVPHIGWNEVTLAKPSPLFEGIADGTDFYFVHSYRLESPPEQTVATVDYCGRTVAAAAHDNIVAVQFHPEKSQSAGFQLLRNFLAFQC